MEYELKKKRERERERERDGKKINPHICTHILYTSSYESTSIFLYEVRVYIYYIHHVYSFDIFKICGTKVFLQSFVPKSSNV